MRRLIFTGTYTIPTRAPVTASTASPDLGSNADTTEPALGPSPTAGNVKATRTTPLSLQEPTTATAVSGVNTTAPNHGVTKRLTTTFFMFIFSVCSEALFF